MRNTGKTFNILLKAIDMASQMHLLDDTKNGVVMYCYNEDYSKILFGRAVDMLSIYGSTEGFTFQKARATITFPNGKTLAFKSMLEPSYVNKGIDWSLYDELSDHYIPAGRGYDKFFQESVEIRNYSRRKSNEKVSS